eukprot:829479-Amphidinium_carterae.1
MSNAWLPSYQRHRNQQPSTTSDDHTTKEFTLLHLSHILDVPSLALAPITLAWPTILRCCSHEIAHDMTSLKVKVSCATSKHSTH